MKINSVKKFIINLIFQGLQKYSYVNHGPLQGLLLSVYNSCLYTTE